MSSRIPAPSTSPAPSVSAASAAGRAGGGTPRSRPASRRMLMLLLLLIGVVGVRIGIVIWPRHQAAQYASASLNTLADRCGRDGDLPACSALADKAIVTHNTAKALQPLLNCWKRVQAGPNPVSDVEKAGMMGNLALIEVLSDHMEEAQALFPDAIRLDVGCVPAHLAFAFTLSTKNADKHALQELDIVTTIEPNNYLALFLQAHIYNQNNMLDNARPFALKSIAANPNFSSAWQELGDSYAYAAKYVEALKAYQQELKLDPDSRTARADVARAEALTATTPAQYQEAVKNNAWVLAHYPPDVGTVQALVGELHLRFGHYPEARQMLELAVKADPTIPDRYYQLAQARRFVGDKAGADEATRHYQKIYTVFQDARKLQKALSEHPNDAELHAKLAADWEHYQAWPEALEEYSVVLQIRPNDRNALEHLNAIRRLQQQNKAITPYNWVLDILRRHKSKFTMPTSLSAATGATPK